MRKILRFDELEQEPLIIDAIYEGCLNPDISADPLFKLFSGIGNLGGFRVVYNIITRKPAYVIFRFLLYLRISIFFNNSSILNCIFLYSSKLKESFI